MTKRLVLCLSLAAFGCGLLSAESSDILSPQIPPSAATAKTAAASKTPSKTKVAVKKNGSKKKAAVRTLSGRIVSIRPSTKGGELLVISSGKRDLRIFVPASLSGKLTGLRVGQTATLRYRIEEGKRVALGALA